MTDEERDWVQRSLEGDPEAFAALVRRYQRMIHALAYRMTGSLTEAEDLAQETFIQAYQQLGGFRAEACFSSWLYRIAVNRCLNWRQRAARRDRVHLDWAEQQQTTTPPTDGPGRMVQEALMRLPAKQRAAVALTIYDGMSHAEAARVLGCSEATVSWRLFAARKKLRRLLRHVQLPRDAQ